MESSSSPIGAKATLLRHFPGEIREAYARSCAAGDSAAVDTVVVGVLLDHVPDKAKLAAIAPDDSVALVADLGLDSIAIAQVVFFLEDLFEINISNTEILGVRTIGDMRVFIRRKLADLSIVPRA